MRSLKLHVFMVITSVKLYIVITTLVILIRFEGHSSRRKMNTYTDTPTCTHARTHTHTHTHTTQEAKNKHLII